MIRMDWFYSNLLGGIKLKVRAEDAEAANEILSQPIPEMVDVEGVGEYEQPKCPRCQSLDVVFRSSDKLLSYGSAYVGFPVPVSAEGWTCHACGNQWEEENALPPGDEAHPGSSWPSVRRFIIASNESLLSYRAADARADDGGAHRARRPCGWRSMAAKSPSRKSWA